MIDFLTIFKNFIFKMLNGKFFNPKNKIILSKGNHYSNYKIKFSKALIEASNNSDISNLHYQIKNFLSVMERNSKNFDSTIFINNFKKTYFNIKNINDNFTVGKDGSVEFEKINKFNIKSHNCVYHELLHLASFENITKYILPFYEGYTQLLAENYFNESVGKSYTLEVMVLKQIETILGKDYMEKLYFNGEFYEIIYQLNYYEKKENIEALLINVLEIFDISESNSYIEEKEKLEKCLISVFKILFSCFKNKVNSIDDIDEKITIINNSYWPTSFHFIYKNQTSLDFYVLDEKEIDEFKESTYDFKTNHSQIK